MKKIVLLLAMVIAGGLGQSLMATPAAAAPLPVSDLALAKSQGASDLLIQVGKRHHRWGHHSRRHHRHWNGHRHYRHWRRHHHRRHHHYWRPRHGCYWGPYGLWCRF